MNNFRYCGQFFRSTIFSFGQLFKIVLFILSLAPVNSLLAQHQEPETCIKELKKGTLIIRIPTNKPKIDTLTAMISRSTDLKKKDRLEKQLRQAIEERDTLLSDYVFAFKNNFDFCTVGYFFDYEGHDLNTASYYNIEGERISVADLSEKPLFYLYFERTSDSKIDALVVYNRSIQKIESPFPNNFPRGGLNALFLSISGKNFALWRVGKMNKKFYKYLDRVIAYETYADKP